MMSDAFTPSGKYNFVHQCQSLGGLYRNKDLQQSSHWPQKQFPEQSVLAPAL